jgi:hypothetical protein
MPDLSLDAIEREELCDLMSELGPEAPTLLAPWTTHDLAAHLVIREHDYRAAPGSSPWLDPENRGAQSSVSF